jgi:hypothetical protein
LGYGDGSALRSQVGDLTYLFLTGCGSDQFRRGMLLGSVLVQLEGDVRLALSATQHVFVQPILRRNIVMRTNEFRSPLQGRRCLGFAFRHVFPFERGTDRTVHESSSAVIVALLGFPALGYHSNK